MKIQPLDKYEKPKYKSFIMKNGKPLAAGIACLAMAGALSGCGAVAMESTDGVPTIHPTAAQTGTIPNTEVLDGDVVNTPVPATFEVLAGYMPAPSYSPEPTPEALDGEFPAPTYTPEALDGKVAVPSIPEQGE